MALFIFQVMDLATLAQPQLPGRRGSECATIRAMAAAHQGIGSERLRTGYGLTRRLRAADAAAAAADDAVAAAALHEQKKVARREAARKRRSRAADAAAAPKRSISLAIRHLLLLVKCGRRVICSLGSGTHRPLHTHLSVVVASAARD